MTKKISHKQFCELVDLRSGMPVPLREADVTKPFVYDRQFGVFPGGKGSHPLIMATLYEWEHGEKERSHSWPHDLADKYIKETKGTCFLSSVGKAIMVGKKGNLNNREIKFFHDVVYIENS